LTCSHVCLLFDDMPGVIAPWCRSQSKTPREMETIADLAHRAVEDLECFCVPEPRLEVLGDLRGALELRGPVRKQRSHRCRGIEALGHVGEVALGQRFEKKAAD